MANKDLYNKIFTCPKNILDRLHYMDKKYGDYEGIGKDRVKNILNNPKITYQNIKRIKNFFDTHQEKDTIFEFNGGDLMYNWVTNILNKKRDSLEGYKKIKSDIGVGNSFRKSHYKDTTKNVTKVNIPKIKSDNKSLTNGYSVYEHITEILNNINNLLK